MPLWRNIQRLSFSGAVQGVVNPGSTDVITPLQGVQITDDASAIVAPPRYPHCWVAAGTGTALTEFSGLEIAARAAGIWVLQIVNRGSNANVLRMWRDDDQAVTARAPAGDILTMGVPNGERPESAINDIRVAALPAVDVGINLDPDNGIRGSWFIYPGERFYVANLVSDTQLSATIQLREVPVRLRA